MECLSDTFFVLRTPILPLSTLVDCSRLLEAPKALPEDLAKALLLDRAFIKEHLHEWFAQPYLREALYLASPELEAQLEPWMACRLDSVKAERVEGSLMRYFARMASRPTPFGLFAGWALGSWGPNSRLEAGHSGQVRRHTRLEMGYLSDLSDTLSALPEIRRTLRYFPNSSMYRTIGDVRYVESRRAPDGSWAQHLVSVQSNAFLDQALRHSAGGASLSELASDLVVEGISETEAEDFVEELIDCQILVSRLAPSLTGADPLESLATCLGEHPATSPLSRVLERIRSHLGELDAEGMGIPVERYRGIRQEVDKLGCPFQGKQLFQTDLRFETPNLVLGPKVRASLEAGVRHLQKLGCSPTRDHLEDFRRAFVDRYDRRWVPLMEALDQEIGIGFGANSPPSANNMPLLEGLSLSMPSEPEHKLGKREAFLLKRLRGLQGKMELELEEQALDELGSHNNTELPATFFATVTLSADASASLDSGNFQYFMPGYYGPSATRVLGRFCHMDEALRQKIQEHIRHEEASVDAIFAEIVHLPDGRMGNLAARPILRTHEIPYLGRSGVPPEYQILPNDLEIAILGSQIHLRSVSLGREVIPRLASSHGYSLIGSGLYRFLGLLQEQDLSSRFWSWGGLTALPYLPRVRIGQHVLSRARWIIEPQAYSLSEKDPDEALWTKVQLMRAKEKLPQWILLTDGESELAFDLDNISSLRSLLKDVYNRPSITLTELWPVPTRQVARNASGIYAHELVVPFRGASAKPSPCASTNARPTPSIQRSFPPGSEWMYIKIYIGPTSADKILLQGIHPLLEQTRGLWDSWFFTRFTDPYPHLRIRIHGDPGAMMGEFLLRLNEHINPFREQGSLWRLQLDSYEREVERYGGGMGMELAESLFWADSEFVLDCLRCTSEAPMAEVRWRIGLKMIDLLADAMGLELEQKCKISRGAKRWHAKDLGQNRGLELQLDQAFRARRREVEHLILYEVGEFGLPPEVLPLLDAHLARIKPRLGVLRKAWDEGQLSEDLGSLYASFAHMHINRLLPTFQWAQEYVMFDILDRLYTSKMARSTRWHKEHGEKP